MDYTAYDMKAPYPRKEDFADQTSFREACLTWHVTADRLKDQFRNDALTEVGLIGHPRAFKAFKFAWNCAREATATEDIPREDILAYLRDLAELMLDDPPLKEPADG